MSDDPNFEEAASFVSALGTGREGFHSEVTEYVLRIGERMADDFMRHFPPAKIMQALAGRPTERARIIAEATGVHDRVAHKMSPENSGEALDIALEEKVTTTADIVRLFQPDDRQRYLERRALWKFAIEGEPWKASSTSKPAYDRASAFIAYVLRRALENQLLNHAELVGALTIPRLAEHLPRERLASIIAASLERADKFSETHLLDAVPVDVLVKHVPLDYIWQQVVVPLVAERHEFSERLGDAAVTAEALKSEASPKSDDAKPRSRERASLTSLKDAGPRSGTKSTPGGEKGADEENDLVGEDEIMDDAL